MNTDKGRLNFATGIDNSQLRADAAESKNILHSIGNSAQEESNRMDASFGKIAKAAGGIFAVSQITEFAKQIISVRGEIESLQISFETLAGKDKGSALFREIRQFAVATPMMMKDLAQGAQTMLAFNIEAEKVMPILRALGDISMGDAQKFNSLALAFSQMSATGKLMGQDLLQMINAGFNPLSVISEKTGKSIGELKEEMEKGKISVEMVTDAFMTATAAGGKFHGMLEKQSHGINGAISNLQGAIDDMLNDFGKSSQGIITGAIDGATYLVKNYEAVAEILAVIVGTYGIYKGAVIANEALIQASMTAKDTAVKQAYESEMTALTALLPQKEAEAQTSLQQAVAAGHISQEKASQITMIRAEAEAQLEALAITESAANARIMASQADIATALKWEDEINDKIEVLNQEADALFDNGDSIAFNAKQEEIAALKAELLEVQKERETAVEAVNTAATEMNAASHQQNAIATAEDSAATAVNTAQTATNTGATSALSIAKSKLIGVVRSLYTTISAHPFALAAAAVAALAYGIYKLVTYETDAEKAQKRLNNAISESKGAWEVERIKIDVMFDRLRKAKEGTDELKKAKQAIIDQYGNYLNGLSSEISSLKDVEGAYNAVTEAALKAARARSFEKLKKEEDDDYAEKYAESYDKIYEFLKKEKGEAFAKANEHAISDIISGKRNWSQSFISQFDKSYVSQGNNLTGASLIESNKLQELTDEARKRQKDYLAWIDRARKRFGIDDEEKNETSPTSKHETKNKAYWENLKKEAEAELAALSSIEARGQKGQQIRAKIAKYEEELKSAYGPRRRAADNTKTPIDSTMLQNEYDDAVKKQVRQNELDLEQERINGMEEGVDKYLAQAEVTYKRMKLANEDREAAMVKDLRDKRQQEWENANPNASDQERNTHALELQTSVTAADLSEEQKNIIEEYSKFAEEYKKNANKESLDVMIKDVLTYEQARLKIEEDYAEKRKALYKKDKNGNPLKDANGNAVLRDGVEQENMNELNRQEQEALNNLQKTFSDRAVTELKLSIDWEKAFGDLDAVATSSLNNLKKKLQDYIKTQKDLDPENLKILKEAIEKIDEKLSSRNPFDALGKSFNKLRTANESVKKAQEAYNKTLKEGNDLEKEQAKVTLDAAKNAKQKALADANKSIQATCNNLQEYISLATALSDMLGAFGVEMPEELTGFIGGMSNAIAGLESMDLMRPFSIITGAVKTVTGIFQGIGSLFGFGNGDKKKEKRIENLQQQIEDLEEAYDRLDKKIDGVYGKDAAALLEQQNAMLLTQKALIQNQTNEELAKKHTDDERVREWRKQIEEIDELIAENSKKAEDAIFGQDIQAAIENFADAYAQAWADGTDSATSARDTVKKMMQSMVTESIKAAIQSSNAMQKIRDKLKEFYADNVLSGWEQDYIYNMAENLQSELDKQFGWAQSLFEEDQERQAAQKGIATASQESVDELNGRMTAIQSHTFSINETTKLLLSTTQSILQSVMNIESETDGFGARLERMEGCVKGMATTLNEMATRGIRIKN